MVVTPNGSTLIVAESYGTTLTAFDIAGDGGLSHRRVWAALHGASPTGSASTPKTPCGTRTSPTGGACAIAKVVRFCTRSTSTAAASRVRSAGQTGERSS